MNKLLKEPSQRQLKIGEEIKHLLSQLLIRKETHIKELDESSIMISQVSVSPDMTNARGISFSDLKKKLLKISEYFFDDLFIYDIAKLVIYCDGCITIVGSDFIIFYKLLPEGPAIIPAIVIVPDVVPALMVKVPLARV